MKQTRYLFFFAPLLALSQFTYSELKQRVADGGDRYRLQAELRENGVHFDVDLDQLKKMKKDKMPDWLIDTLVMMDQPVTRDVYYDDDEYLEDHSQLGYYRPYYFSYSPWGGMWFDYDWGFPLYALGYGYFNPWSSWSYPYWASSYGYNYGLRPSVPGNRISPRGHINNQPRRIRGHARPRNSGSSQATQDSSRSRGSDKGGRVTTRGYRRN